MVTKSDVIKLFGSVEATASAVGSSGSAVSQWPENISKHIQDRVLGSCVRLGISFPPEWVNGQQAEASGQWPGLVTLKQTSKLKG